MRKKIKGLAVRTSLIVGYPTETEEQFEELCDFVKEVKFDKLGVFEYSREKNTISYKLKPQIPARTKHARFKKLMQIQQKISKEINESYIGKTLPCIIEGVTDDGFVIARTEHDAPEVDGLVYIKTDKNVVPGDIENVKITSASEYDLYGEI